MNIKFLHLFPAQLGLNGETGNLTTLVKRLQWSGTEASIETFSGGTALPKNVAAVFIGSGTLSGAVDALALSESVKEQLVDFANAGVPFLALGLGWEILGKELELVDGARLEGIGIFPSSSKRVSVNASEESFGYDPDGNLTVGYANHSSNITLGDSVSPLIELTAGFGNSSTQNAKLRSDEGLMAGNLMAARLNGPLLALNPHLADRFIDLIASRSEFDYQVSDEARKVDEFAAKARLELKNRLAR